MTKSDYAANIRAFRYDETNAATELLEDATMRLEHEIADLNGLASIDLQEYAAIVSAYVQAERFYLDLLKEQEGECNEE